MENVDNHTPRRQFIQQSAALSATVMLAGSTLVLAGQNAEEKAVKNTVSKGYAAKTKSEQLALWSFERRAVGDNDILIEVKYSGICHSDIHQIRGHWGEQTYPQLPVHEIAGIVSAVGKNVTKFNVGDQAGVGCMVHSCTTCASCTNGEEHHCDNHATVFTCGSPDKSSPTVITQSGYTNNMTTVRRIKFILRSKSFPPKISM